MPVSRFIRPFDMRGAPRRIASFRRSARRRIRRRCLRMTIFLRLFIAQLLSRSARHRGPGTGVHYSEGHGSCQSPVFGHEWEQRSLPRPLSPTASFLHLPSGGRGRVSLPHRCVAGERQGVKALTTASPKGEGQREEVVCQRISQPQPNPI